MDQHINAGCGHRPFGTKLLHEKGHEQAEKSSEGYLKSACISDQSGENPSCPFCQLDDLIWGEGGGPDGFVKCTYCGNDRSKKD